MNIVEILKNICISSYAPAFISLRYIGSKIVFSNYKVMSNKYKLIKDNKYPSNSKVIYESESLNAVRNIRNNDLSKQIQSITEEILIKLSKEVSSESFNIIKQNLNTIKDTTNLINSIGLSITSKGGAYKGSNHSISLNELVPIILKSTDLERNKQIRIILSHELMHAASSYKKNEKVASGFRQGYVINNAMTKKNFIGTGINEGYTDLMTKRYLVKDYGTNKIGYAYEEKIALLTELIVGKDKMINLYFQANLKGLVEELTKYSSVEETKEFITILDTITNIKTNKLIIEKEDLLGSLMNRVNIYLYKAFNTKTNIDPKYKNIDKYIEESNTFLEIFNNIEEELKPQKNNTRN